jgi:hypothetical protein
VKLDPATVNDLALGFQPSCYLRVLPSVHMATPLGMGFGFTRFSSPGNAFRLVYDVATAIAEIIIRDRFEGASDRVFEETEIEKWALAEVAATSTLTVLGRSIRFRPGDYPRNIRRVLLDFKLRHYRRGGALPRPKADLSSAPKDLGDARRKSGPLPPLLPPRACKTQRPGGAEAPNRK